MNLERLDSAKKLAEKINNLKQSASRLRGNIVQNLPEKTNYSDVLLTKAELMSILERAEKELAEAEAEFSAM